MNFDRLLNELVKAERTTSDEKSKVALRQIVSDLRKNGISEKDESKQGNDYFQEYADTHVLEIIYANDEGSKTEFCLTKEVALRERDSLVKKIVEGFLIAGTNFSCLSEGDTYTVTNDDEDTEVTLEIIPQMIKV